MQKWVLLLVCLGFVYAEPIIERNFKYQQEACGDDYHCFAYEDFISNVDIKEAFKQDLQKEIQSPKYDIRGLIYEQILSIGLPNKNLKTSVVIKTKNGDLNAEIEFIKSKDRLVIIYIVEAEESIKTYIQMPNGVKILNKTSML